MILIFIQVHLLGYELNQNYKLWNYKSLDVINGLGRTWAQIEANYLIYICNKFQSSSFCYSRSTNFKLSAPRRITSTCSTLWTQNRNLTLFNSEYIPGFTRWFLLTMAGWRLRIHHNIRSVNSAQRHLLCRMYCRYNNVDLCDIKETIGSLVRARKRSGNTAVSNEQISNLNRLIWRYLPMIDPQVLIKFKKSYLLI